MGLRRRAGGRVWLSCRSWPRPLGAGTPLPRGGEEIGVCACEAHCAGRGWGSLPPLGMAGYPAGERGNTGEPDTSSAGPPERRNHVNYSLFSTVSDRWSTCAEPEIHSFPILTSVVLKKTWLGVKKTRKTYSGFEVVKKPGFFSRGVLFAGVSFNPDDWGQILIEFHLRGKSVLRQFQHLGISASWGHFQSWEIKFKLNLK